VFESATQNSTRKLETGTFLISTLEGATAVSRIDKRSSALAYAQENLDRFLEAEVRSPAEA
jgi:hypothetical protein